MAMRRKDAERRPVSLAIEALEDRFLLSGAALLPAPTTPSASAHETTVHNSAHPTPAAGVSQPIPAASGNDSIAIYFMPSLLPFPVHPSGYQRDVDNDDGYGERRDSDPSRNAASPFPVAVVCSDVTGEANSDLCIRLLQQGTEASPVSFLPLLAAAGFGVLGPASRPWSPPAMEIAGNVSGDRNLPGRAEGNPLTPQLPEALPATLPPLAEESAEAVPPSSPRSLPAERLAIDLEALQRGADAFFQQLSQLSEYWRDRPLLEKLAPWLLATSLAGYGWVRFRNRWDRRAADLAGPDGLIALSIFFPGEEG